MTNLHNGTVLTQAIFRSRQYLNSLNLQGRFMLIMGVSSVIFTLLSWTLFNHFTKQLIERIGTDFAEKQMLYDKARTLQPLLHDIALAREMADSFPLRAWADNEQDRRLAQIALDKLEAVRGHFHSGSYFVAFTNSGNFYYRDSAGPDHRLQLRYVLNPSQPDDAWFFDFIKSGENQRTGVARNNKLNMAKIWVVAPIRNGTGPIGVIGTGIDLDDYLHNQADINQPSVTNMFINHLGVIQIFNDVGHSDFPSVDNHTNEPHSTDQVLDADSGQKWTTEAVKKLNEGTDTVETGFVRINGTRYLAGMIEIPELGWYDLTLINLSLLLPGADVMEIGLAIIVGILGMLSIQALSLHQLVLKPVATLTEAAARIRRGDYSQRPLQNGSSGEVQELAAQFHDMADAINNTQNWLEAQIETRTRQLSDARKMLEISLQHEKDGRETQANLMALMAHEMRSPVAVISNTAQMLNLLAQKDHPEWSPRIEKIMRSVKQLATLMDNFLTEKWLDMDKHGLNMEMGDLNQLCHEISLAFTDSHERTISFEQWESDAILFADWKLIRIAIDNLVENACKYSPPGKEVNLKILSWTTDWLCVEVRNQGEWIPPELQAHIFEKFVRGRHEGDIQGSGLGLYLVSWIAKFHGGYTEVSSTKGQGSVFRFCIPM